MAMGETSAHIQALLARAVEAANLPPPTVMTE